MATKKTKLPTAGHDDELVEKISRLIDRVESHEHLLTLVGRLDSRKRLLWRRNHEAELASRSAAAKAEREYLRRQAALQRERDAYEKAAR